MLKFIKHHMETIAGIEIYPLISLCIFFAFFIGLIYFVIRLKDAHVKAMESLPFENENEL